jgi:hypothetical protein
VAQIIRQQGNPTRAASSRNAGRHQVGTVGEIISECLGDFVGIRRVGAPETGDYFETVDAPAPASGLPASSEKAYSYQFQVNPGHPGMIELFFLAGAATSLARADRR